ncbi:MAG: guanylate kinase [Candidatus Gracilibacteria bacterium]|nr:guanylate kinase [Candidatus Gracilibacteria bacterium]
MNKPLLIIISGPSGVGKDSIISGLTNDETLDFEKIVTTTSRSLRNSEIDGAKYYHISKDEFESGINEGKFIEHELVHDNHYGATFEEFNRILDKGKHILYELDVAGAIKIKKKLDDRFLIRTIFISPPSLDTLLERLKSRGTESEESIERRILTAKNEMKYMDFYDHIIVNDVLEQAILDTINIIKNVR